MDTDPREDAGAILQQAVEAQRAGNQELAYDLYARATELDPNAVPPWQGRAATSPFADDALVSCAYAVALAPNDESLAAELDQRIRARASAAKKNEAGGLIAVGQKLAEVGLVGEAHLILRCANELDDTIEEGYIWTAATTEDLNEASVALKRALALSPRDARARAGFSAVMLGLDGAQVISPTQAQAFSASPHPVPLADSAGELIRTGEKALVAGNKTLAYQAFVRATELAPREEAGWLGRARACADIDETLTCLEQALAINPDNMQAREARTFYRVRKLREGVRKRQEPEVEEPRFMPSFAGGGGFTEQPTPEIRQRRIVLLVIMILVLLFLVLAVLIQFQIIGK